MNLTKSIEYFDPANVPERIHVIGCGSIGSAVVNLLASAGLTRITIYDDDTVEPHNLGNQMFTVADINKKKAEALKEQIISINPEAEEDVKVCGKYTDQMLSGYVFLCVDNIDVRREIAEANQYNAMVKAMFDFRTGLENAACYAAAWNNQKQIGKFIGSMNYTHEEAKEETSTGACGNTLGMKSTVWMCSLLGVDNFITFIKTGKLKNCILMDAFKNGGSVLAM